MTDQLVSHEEIENAFKPARNMADQMHDTTMKRRAEEHLKVAEDYVHQDREQAKVIDRDEPADMRIVTLRGPAMSGWPWRWTAGAAP